LILKEFQDADLLQLIDSLRVSAIFTRARRRESRLQAAFRDNLLYNSILAEQSSLKCIFRVGNFPFGISGFLVSEHFSLLTTEVVENGRAKG